MIVKVNKKGVASDCGCNKKLAKGGCAPKKKKIKKNKNGGYIMTDDIPYFLGGSKIYPLKNGVILNKDNTPKIYKKKIYDQKGKNPYYTEEVILYPQQSEHGIIDKEPTVLGRVGLDRMTNLADSTLKYLPTGSEDFIINISNTKNSKRNPAWDYFWNLINTGKAKKK